MFGFNDVLLRRLFCYSPGASKIRDDRGSDICLIWNEVCLINQTHLGIIRTTLAMNEPQMSIKDIQTSKKGNCVLN